MRNPRHGVHFKCSREERDGSDGRNQLCSKPNTRYYKSCQRGRHMTQEYSVMMWSEWCEGEAQIEMGSREKGSKEKRDMQINSSKVEKDDIGLRLVAASADSWRFKNLEVEDIPARRGVRECRPVGTLTRTGKARETANAGRTSLLWAKGCEVST